MHVRRNVQCQHFIMATSLDMERCHKTVIFDALGMRPSWIYSGESAQGVVILKIDRILYGRPVSSVLLHDSMYSTTRQKQTSHTASETQLYSPSNWLSKEERR